MTTRRLFHVANVAYGLARSAGYHLFQGSVLYYFLVNLYICRQDRHFFLLVQNVQKKQWFPKAYKQKIQVITRLEQYKKVQNWLFFPVQMNSSCIIMVGADKSLDNYVFSNMFCAIVGLCFDRWIYVWQSLVFPQITRTLTKLRFQKLKNKMQNLCGVWNGSEKFLWRNISFSETLSYSVSFPK